MDFSIFVTPLGDDLINSFSTQKNTLGEKIDFYNGFEIPKECQVAILGIKESRGSQVKSVKESPDSVRKEFYSLFQSSKISIVDLGNIEEGETLNDTLFAVSQTLAELIKLDIILSLLEVVKN